MAGAPDGPQTTYGEFFQADNTTVQYWNLMQTVLQEHGLKTDIVYADPDFPLPPIYVNIYRAS